MSDQPLNSEDVFAALRAEEDQAAAAIGTMATRIATYFGCLMGLGFQRHEALDLVRDFQQALFDESYAAQHAEEDDE